MTKFRKKPIVVEAEQWFPGKDVPGVCLGLEGEHGCYVVTAHGQRVFLTPGDWVIAEPDGNGHYPVKDAIFRDTFEPADAGADGHEHSA